MRIFPPATMERPHWHGHLELNFIRNAAMHYIIDGEKITVEPGQLLVFWAGIPHQLVEVESRNVDRAELCNLYLPLDSFLSMPYIPRLQVAMVAGGMIHVSKELCDWPTLQRWYLDYRSNDTERVECLKMELNALFRRSSLEDFQFVRNPWRGSEIRSGIASSHVRHVVAMVRHVLENWDKPLHNEDVTRVTGLHTNYALTLFSKTMQMPLTKFIIRMRLLRARGLLLESNMAISSIAVESGFNSMSQFYQHFSTAYGTTPKQLRESYITKSKRQ